MAQRAAQRHRPARRVTDPSQLLHGAARVRIGDEAAAVVVGEAVDAPAGARQGGQQATGRIGEAGRPAGVVGHRGGQAICVGGDRGPLASRCHQRADAAGAVALDGRAEAGHVVDGDQPAGAVVAEGVQDCTAKRVDCSPVPAAAVEVQQRAGVGHDRVGDRGSGHGGLDPQQVTARADGHQQPPGLVEGEVVGEGGGEALAPGRPVRVEAQVVVLGVPGHGEDTTVRAQATDDPGEAL